LPTIYLETRNCDTHFNYASKNILSAERILKCNKVAFGSLIDEKNKEDSFLNVLFGGVK
jgi:hypothetical protein